MCSIHFPISDEKTVYATTLIVFLGLLINSVTRTLCILVDKRDAALGQIDMILWSKKIKMHKLEALTGLLNFLCRAIVPGRTFTRCFYDRIAGVKQHHHIRVDHALKEDLLVWKNFLKNSNSLCRPFMDFSEILKADELDFYTDASLSNERAGFGVVYGKTWTFSQFPDWMLDNEQVAIHTLEMYALVLGVTLHANSFRNRRIKVFCDNQAVVHMINNGTSKCKTCMLFIRHLVKISLQRNCRVFAKYVPTDENSRADALSRLDIDKFCRLSSPEIDNTPLPLPPVLWPVRREWWLTN